MRSAKTVGMSLLALLALGAFVASSASAGTTKKLTLLTAKGVLAEKAEVKATSANLVLTTTAGKLECSEVTIVGSLVKNTEAKDDVTSSSVTFAGKEAEGACKSTFTGGAAKVTLGHTPWTEVLSGASQAAIKAAKPPEITYEFASKEKCTYFARTFKSKFKAGAAGTPEAISDTLTADPVSLLKHGSSTTCIEKGEIGGTFTFTSAGETLESEI